MRKLLLLPMLFLLGNAQATGVYKCTMEGREVFTDTPCFSDEPPIDLPPVNRQAAVPAPSGAELAKRHDQRIAKGKAARDKADAAYVKGVHAKKKQAEAVRAAIIEHRVMKGMTPSEVRSARGEPDRIEASGVWLFEGNGKLTSVQFDDAKLVSKVATKTDHPGKNKNGSRSHRR